MDDALWFWQGECLRSKARQDKCLTINKADLDVRLEPFSLGRAEQRWRVEGEGGDRLVSDHEEAELEAEWVLDDVVTGRRRKRSLALTTVRDMETKTDVGEIASVFLLPWVGVEIGQ